ncbi:MAG: radical SAM protein [Candidatus Sericytochromatia bacterium]
MKIILSILPSFELRRLCFPSAGIACIKAYLKKNLPNIEVTTIDLRTQPESLEIWRPEDFPQITIKKSFVSDIYELSIIASLITNYQKFNSISKTFPAEEVIEKWSYDRTILPDFIIQKLEDTHKFALKNLIKFGGYKLVGFSVYTSNLYLSILMAIFIKISYPDTKIVFGGPQITQSDSTRELLLKSEIVDYLVLGEGEQPFFDIINSLTNNEPIDNKIGVKTINNINEPDTFYQELDLESLPTPDYDGIIFQHYKHKIISIYSNRGCPFRCHFCSEHSLFGKKFKRRSPERVLEDMIYLNKRLDTNTFHFADSLVNSSEEWLEEFVELLSKKYYNFFWEGYFRAEIDPLLVSKMKKVGLRRVILGVESFSQDTLDKMNKKKLKNEILETIDALVKNEIHTGVNLLVGYPGETEEDFLTTIKIARDFQKKYSDKIKYLRFPARSFQMRPFSNIYKVYDKFGLSAENWSNLYDENNMPFYFKDIFEKTLYTFSVNGISITDTLHRLQLVNQIKFINLMMNEKKERLYSIYDSEE